MIDRAAFETEWRVACPRGHVRLQPAVAVRTAYCESCGRSYDWEALVDRKTSAPST